MEISREQAKKIAHMARLKLDQQELDRYIGDMQNILNLAAQLNEVDTSSVQPMAHPLDQTQVLRPDSITDFIDRELFQSVAPLVKDGYYLVPKVIEGYESLEDDE